MRNPEAYKQHGRNDPTDPQQRSEHPYDFVSLPGRPAPGQAVGHHTYPPDRWSGTLTLEYETLTSLHVGSGCFDTAGECNLSGGDVPVRGIVRRQGLPVLPGSSWKGAVRARFEAITRSRLALAGSYSKIPVFKVPEALRGSEREKHKVKITDRRLDALKRLTVTRDEDPAANLRALERLSPAEALFGTMGYRGRVHPEDGRISGAGAAEILRSPPLESPVPHRLAKPGAAIGRGTTIEIRELEGRKFYYDGEVITERQTSRPGPAYEELDHVPPGSTIRLEIHLEAVTLAELGALLLSAGYGEDVGIMRFGGGKPSGLGKVKLTRAEARLAQGSANRSWKRPPLEEMDLEEAIRLARSGLVDQAALDELHKITTCRRA